MAPTSRSSLKPKWQTLLGIVIDRDGLPSDWYLYREDKDNKISHASLILRVTNPIDLYHAYQLGLC